MLLLASVTSLMCALDTLVVSTALTSIRADLGGGVEALEWTVNAAGAVAGAFVPGRRIPEPVAPQGCRA
ncbi:hypothetical protein ACQPX6_22185 [Actinomycetospora sp. CA-101289]|uniref:hypothetical protein n=1 Tax=Actinomycetospora sp. CA-101289 TaxID=3239893 RepID=UPI003D978FFC